MDYLRSKKWKKELEKTEHFFDYSDNITNYYTTINCNNKQNECYVSNSVWDDINYSTVINDISKNNHVRNFITKMLKHPTYDKSLLELRQQSILYFNKSINLKPILNNEFSQKIEWFLDLDPNTKNYVVDILYPKSILFKWLYLDYRLINIYQIYRSYWNPLIQLIYPLSVIIMPYIYINNKLKINVSFKSYINTIYTTIKFFATSSRRYIDKVKNISGILIYIGIYIYNILQTIDLANQLRKYRNILIENINIITTKINDFQKIVESIKIDFWKPFIPNVNRDDITRNIIINISNFNTYWKYPSNKDRLLDIYRVMGIYDCLCNISGYINKDWNICKYNQYNSTILGNMKHPELTNTVSNPIKLDKHLIVTGPNAAGKTTYVKSLLWNIILSQSFGIVRSSYANINLYDAIVHHDRIKDSIGDVSLFEAEMFKIKEVLNKCKLYKNVIYFLDEPLHSTPPVDGSAMLKSYLLYLANNYNINMLLTTHYFSISKLELSYPDKFRNISMESSLVKGKFTFPYKIKKGNSTQSISIELLKEKEFPEELISTAIKIKNKIYLDRINVY